jgi:two-component system nitrate/nitrite response regulator NarL
VAVTQALRVVIADDHPPTRAGVRQALELDGFEVVADVGDAPKAVAAAHEQRPDVCVLDIHMPGGGIAAAREITGRHPGTAVVMLTASRDDEDLFEALRAGARGYLLKDMDPDRLGSALRGVLDGEAALPRALVLRLMTEFAAAPARGLLRRSRPATAKLTSREVEVLDLMADGLSTEQIAGRLFIGQVTVRTHVSNVLKKLGAKDREAAVRIARQD